MLVLLCATFMASAQTTQVQELPLDSKTRYGKLGNGLTYYIRHNNNPRGQANFYIAQKVGSVLEEDNQRGLAHFLEHMCFNGTKNYPGNQVIKYLETIGVKFGEQLNAYTAVDQTVYNINNVPTQRVETIDSVMLILHDWSHDLLLNTEDIDKERGVIHEEWRSGSSASMRIFERQLPKLMSNSRPGNRLPIGLMEIVDNFKPEVLRAYYEKWYRPDLQGIIIVGDLDVDRTEQRLKEIFADIPAPINPAERVYYSVPDNVDPIVVIDHDKEQTVPVVMIAYKHEDMMPREMRNSVQYLVASYMRNMGLAMINQRLIELAQNPEVPFLSASVEDDDFLLSSVTKSFGTQIIPKEGQFRKAVESVMTEVYRAAEHGFTPTEYERVRAEFLSGVEAMYNNRETASTAGYVNECVEHFLHNTPMPGIEVEYALYNQVLPNVSVEMVNQLFASLVHKNDSNLVILSMNPEKQGYVQPTEQELLGAVHAAQVLKLEPYVDKVKNEPLISLLPRPGSIRSEHPGKYGSTVLTLSNGVKLVLKQTDFKANEVVMNAFSPGGKNRYGVQDKYTLHLLNALVSSSGLGEFSNTELPKALAGKQAKLLASVGEFTETLTGFAVPKDLRTLFELIYLRFQPLKRDDKAVSAFLEQQRLSLRNQVMNPMTTLQDSLRHTLYGDNPYMVNMKESDIQYVSYDRAIEIYNDRFGDASDFTFVFVGNFNNDSIRAYATQYLATLPALGRKEKMVDSHIDYQSGQHICRFEKQQEQPSCTMVLLKTAPIKYTLKNALSADILGQVLDIRLMETIREEMSAAYSINTSAGLSPAKNYKNYRVSLQVYAPVKPEMVDTCLSVIKQELEQIADQGVSQTNLEKIREYMLKSHIEAQRENTAWMTTLSDFYRMNIDGWTLYEQTLKGLDSKDIQQIAKQLLKAKNEFTVIMLPTKK